MQPAARRFAAVTAAIVRHLPFGLSRRVPATLVGFALVNTTTFCVDLAVLTACRSGLGWPVPAAVTCGYATSFALGFALNRVLNFRSHADVGPQVVSYVAVVVVNYLLWVLGLVTWLSHAGLDYRTARLVSACCEVVYMYAALRWIVFREQPAAEPVDDRPEAAQPVPDDDG